MTSHIWTTLTRGDRDFDKDINKRSVAAARKHLTGPYALHKKLGTLIRTDRPYYKERIDGIIGQFEETAEGIQEAPPMMPIPVGDMTIRIKYYTAALVLSKNRVEDEGGGLIQKLVPKISERAIEKMEIDFQTLFFGNPTVYNPLRDLRDGVALGSTAHPAGPYGALSGNAFGAPTQLSETALAQVVSSFMAVRDDNGDLAPIMATTFTLGVHPSKLQAARQLVLSLSSTVDYKNSGVRNSATVGGITWEVVPMLYSQNANAWFVVADDDEGTGLTIVARKLPTAPKKIIRENPEQIQYFGEMRYGMAATDWRRFFFSPGA